MSLARAFSRGLLAAALVCIPGTSLCVSRAALAAGSPADIATAQGLFDESKKLIASGQYDVARSKLEESLRLDPSPSTEFYLADCYEHLGRTASAWALFLQAASESRAAGRAEREQFARKRADDLAPRLSRLVIAVPRPELSGLEIKRDGAVIGAGQWGTALPIDPGKHELRASAPNHVEWAKTVDVPADATTITVEIPALDPSASLVSSPPSAAPPVTRSPDQERPQPEDAVAPPATGGRGGAGLSTRRAVGAVAAGAGILALGVGTVFGLEAISKNNDSKTDGCNGNLCNGTGYALRHDALNDATVSSVLFGVGAASLIAGGILWLTAPSHSAAPSTATGITVRLAPGGVLLNGAFE